MVTINYEPLEHLPYLDESISPEERAHVEQLIRIELTNQFANQNLNNINFHPPQPVQPIQQAQPALQPSPAPPVAAAVAVAAPYQQPQEQQLPSSTSISHDVPSQRDVTPTITITSNDIPNQLLLHNNNHSNTALNQPGPILMDEIHHNSTTPINGNSTSTTNDMISPLHESQSHPPSQQLHPLVDQLLPLSTNMHRLSPSPLINQEIERYELEFEDEDFDEDVEEDEFHIIKNSIDFSRYNTGEEGSSSNSSNAHNQIPSINDLYTSLSYQQLTERNLRILLDNNHDLSQLNHQQLQNLQSLQQDYVLNINAKRVKIDELNQVRKKKQSEFSSINTYLETKWKDGIKNVIELGVESSRMEENL